MVSERILFRVLDYWVFFDVAKTNVGLLFVVFVNSKKTSDGKLKCIAVFYKNSLLFQLNVTVKTESLLKR